MVEKLLTPPVINRQPTGLLNFFGIKSGGRNPQNISETIAPVLDLWDLYEQDSILTYGDSVGVAAGGALGAWDFGGATFTPGIVPEDELWHVIDYSVTLAINAGVTQCRFYVGYQPRITTGAGAGARTEIQVGASEGFEGPAALASRLRLCSDRPFWLPPGAILGGYTGMLNPLATAVQAFQSVRLVKYKRR